MSASAQFPEKLQILFSPARYKVAYGGRGSTKSWGFARALLILGCQKPLRILCVRELQASIADSVHKLLSDQIELLGLQHEYTVEKAQIYGSNGTTFSFEGIRHNVSKVKSYEGIDICWVEEAQAVTLNSWNTLVPTIRKPGSEIWVSFNPLWDSDETYQRFVINTPTNASVVKMSWRDNPWLSDELRQEMEDLKARNYDAYLNVWEGECIRTLEGAIYANEIRQAELEGRITRVPLEPSVSVSCSWDLGRRDTTCIWFHQRVGMEHRFIDFLEASGKDISYFLKALQDKPYIYDTMFLPHDAKAKTLGTKLSIEEQIRARRYRVLVGRKLSIVDGINATRLLWPSMWFDQAKCADGLKHLRNYHFDVSESSGERSVNPVHDAASHAADALRTFAVGMRPPKERKAVAAGDAATRSRFARAWGVLGTSTGWMR